MAARMRMGVHQSAVAMLEKVCHLTAPHPMYEPRRLAESPAPEPVCHLRRPTFRVEIVEDEAERARHWSLADRVSPAFAAYRDGAARADRKIPILQPISRDVWPLA